MKPIVIYHADCLDGFTAAWAVWKRYPDWEFYPGKYGQAPPDVSGRDVCMVDFSYKRPVILEMAKTANLIHIFDHHKTAEADLIDLPPNVFVTFDMGKSGARLAWESFHSSDEVPVLVKQVEDRDLWKFQYSTTKRVTAWLSSQDYLFSNWNTAEQILQNDMSSALTAGEALLQKQAKDIQEILKNSFRVSLEGFEIPIANVPPMWSSDAGHFLGDNDEPFAATFSVEGATVKFSLRSRDKGVDVSEIAKKFGGGGHAHAAGFEVSFEKFVQLMDGRR